MLAGKSVGGRPMDSAEWEWTQEDADAAREIAEQLPNWLFDVHAHLYRTADLGPTVSFVGRGPAVADRPAWQSRTARQVGDGRLQGALFTPMPGTRAGAEAANAFVAEQVKEQDDFRATMLVWPGLPGEKAAAWLEAHPATAGFKCYHSFAEREDTFQAELDEYLPEAVWALAHERGMLILLHLVKSGALADSVNQRALRTHCEKYPGARLVLAHAARGFHAPHTIQGLSALRGLPNVWFDTSAVCEPDALLAILDEFGPGRLMWGSDFPVSQQRGRCVTLGTGFAWVTTDQVDWNRRAFFGQPLLVGLESLRALLSACDRAGLDAGERRDVFCNNARRLLGMMPAYGNRVQKRYQEAKRIIPGGTQLLSKRPEMFAPDQWPAYYREARGCEIWDIDGRHYVDFSLHGIAASLLGFRDPDVTRAVQRCVARGSFCTLNSADEVELAELLCELHPWAEQARFARTGGEIMSVAVRLARAATDRAVVAVCGYHGWHDWYLAANLGENDSLRGHLLPGLEPRGVPGELRGTARAFAYNDREALDTICRECGDRLAAIVMEPCRDRDPEPGFLDYVRERAHQAGALLVFDEISIGWRLVTGGAHLRMGVEPDLAVFAKSMSNGHPMAAVIGTRDAMAGAHDSFISSTYWTDGVGPAAALATIRKMQAVDVPGHCRRIGQRLQQAWQELGQRHGLPLTVPDTYPALAKFSFDHDQAPVLGTLFVQEMLKQGYLAKPVVYVSLAHTDAMTDAYLDAVDRVFSGLAEALDAGNLEQRLDGPVAHTGFRRLL